MLEMHASVFTAELAQSEKPYRAWKGLQCARCSSCRGRNVPGSELVVRCGMLVGGLSKLVGLAAGSLDVEERSLQLPRHHLHA